MRDHLSARFAVSQLNCLSALVRVNRLKSEDLFPDSQFAPTNLCRSFPKPAPRVFIATALQEVLTSLQCGASNLFFRVRTFPPLPADFSSIKSTANKQKKKANTCS